MNSCTIVIVDYGVGNLRSVQKMLEKSGATTFISADPDAIEAADGIVLPGVGAFADAMGNLHKLALVEFLREQALERRKPILGICLGMQLLARNSNEGGLNSGLGIIEAEVELLDVSKHRDWADKKLTLPHIGWNEVQPVPESRLFDGISNGTDFYFVHSYHVRCENKADVAAWCEFGNDFACAIENGNVFATQFHPEKSQSGGIQLINNYVALCGGSTGL
jgi:glutamine amidotransferase